MIFSKENAWVLESTIQLFHCWYRLVSSFRSYRVFTTTYFELFKGHWQNYDWKAKKGATIEDVWFKIIDGWHSPVDLLNGAWKDGGWQAFSWAVSIMTGGHLSNTLDQLTKFQIYRCRYRCFGRKTHYDALNGLKKEYIRLQDRVPKKFTAAHVGNECERTLRMSVKLERQQPRRIDWTVV